MSNDLRLTIYAFNSTYKVLDTKCFVTTHFTRTDKMKID